MRPMARPRIAGGPVAAGPRRWHHRRVATLAIAWAQSAAILDQFSEFAEDAAAYGYWAVLLVVAGDGVFPLLPGETAIVAAAVLAADGSLSLPLVILAGAAGAVIGDSAAFWIGRAGGGPIKRFVTRFAGAERLEAAERMVQRQGPRPGLRGPLPARHPHRDQPLLRRRADGLPALPVLRPPRGRSSGPTQAALLGYFAGKAFADQLWVAFVVAFGVTAARRRLRGGEGAPAGAARARRGRGRAGADAADAEPTHHPRRVIVDASDPVSFH